MKYQDAVRESVEALMLKHNITPSRFNGLMNYSCFVQKMRDGARLAPQTWARADRIVATFDPKVLAMTHATRPVDPMTVDTSIETRHRMDMAQRSQNFVAALRKVALKSGIELTDFTARKAA